MKLLSFFTKKKLNNIEKATRRLNGAGLQGNLSIIELNNLFQFFDYSASSGELSVMGETNQANFYLRNGVLIYGALQNSQKRIGSMLIDSGEISRGQLSHCLDIHLKRGNTKRLGDILISKGFLKYEQLLNVLNTQAREAFFETLTWSKGMFFFYADVSPATEEILINERIDHLLLEGIVRIDENAAE
jgi:hypothetical protein